MLARLDMPPEIPARFTIDEFQAMVDTGMFQGWKVELDQGVIVRMAPAMSQHMYYKRRVYELLRQAFEGREPAREVHTELTLQLGPATLRDADVGVITPFGVEGKYPDASTALLVIEISVTTLAYDLNEKRSDYARNGIPHYWVVDIVGRRVHVMGTPLEGDYAERRPYAFGEAMPVSEAGGTIVIE